jgi:transposase-like protein
VSRSFDEWKEIVSEWQVSGISAAAFVRQRGLAPSSFDKWRKKVGESGREKNASEVARFVEIRPHGHEVSPRQSASMTIKFASNVRVVLKGPVELEQLRAVAEVFRT